MCIRDRCYYAPLVDHKGLLVNDPIINKLADDRWWLSIADSDVIFFAKGLAAGKKLEVEISEPNVIFWQFKDLCQMI